jgi:hypothetical protein
MPLQVHGAFCRSLLDHFFAATTVPSDKADTKESKTIDGQTVERWLQTEILNCLEHVHQVLTSWATNHKLTDHLLKSGADVLLLSAYVVRAAKPTATPPSEADRAWFDRLQKIVDDMFSMWRTAIDKIRTSTKSSFSDDTLLGIDSVEAMAASQVLHGVSTTTTLQAQSNQESTLFAWARAHDAEHGSWNWQRGAPQFKFAEIPKITKFVTLEWLTKGAFGTQTDVADVMKQAHERAMQW